MTKGIHHNNSNNIHISNRRQIKATTIIIGVVGVQALVAEAMLGRKREDQKASSWKPKFLQSSIRLYGYTMPYDMILYGIILVTFHSIISCHLRGM